MGTRLTHLHLRRARISGMRIPFLIAAFMLTSASAHAADRSFTGFARSLDDGKLLYVESHALSGVGSGNEARIVLYRCSPDSPPFARKELEYGAMRTMPTFDFVDARSGYTEGFKRDARGFKIFSRPGAQATLRSKVIAPADALVVDAGFDEFVVEQWTALENGQDAKVPFLVPSMLESLNFRIRKVRDEDIDGEPASVIRLSLAGPVGWFLPDIEVSYRKRDRRLMRYRGLTNIRDASGALLKAQIDFPEADSDTRAVDLASLRTMPLVAACAKS